MWYNSITNNGYSISVWAGYDKPNTSPQLPDTYKRYLTLSKDLQVMLNPTPPPVWEVPSGVQRISGNGRKAYYRVTDSSDSYVKDLTWIELNEYSKLQIQDVKGIDADANWEKKETSKWLEYYKNGGDLNPSVVDKDLYSRMKGGSEE